MIDTPTKQLTWMIQSSTQPMARSELMEDPFSCWMGPRSSSFGSTTSVVGSKDPLPHPSVSLRHRNEDFCAPPTKTKKVNFNGTVRVRRVSRLDRYSDKERSNMWYSLEEYGAIRESAIDTVTKMAKNEAVDMDPNDSSRGLEGRTPQQDMLRQERRRIIMWSVLAEQLENGPEDYETSSEAISACYSLCNQSCVHEAERRGELDALEA